MKQGPYCLLKLVLIAPSSAMGKIFRRAKRKAAELQGDQGLDSVNPLEMIVPDYLEPIILLNEIIEFAGQQRKIIAFATQASLRMLGTYRSEISIDGTFKTAPKGFGQLFTVHTVIDSCAIPCVFACLPTKHMQGYVRVFDALRIRIGNWFPQKVMTDFEVAEVNAVRQVFPQAEITDFENSPANGICGKGLKRKAIYVQQDRNLQRVFAEFLQRADDPLRYLRTVSYHLAEI
ncbi:hypothetical protein niasHT_033103 [Heterodera trifolii]|uniref:MULE transposase domain-containing protein n=1 Tax=Heterodera trifolii TaxID=157864 RepID=A0ABD2IPJ9_9BILA